MSNLRSYTEYFSDILSLRDVEFSENEILFWENWMGQEISLFNRLISEKETLDDSNFDIAGIEYSPEDLLLYPVAESFDAQQNFNNTTRKILNYISADRKRLDALTVDIDLSPFNAQDLTNISSQNTNLIPNAAGELLYHLINDQSFETVQAAFGANPAFDLIGLTQLRNDPNLIGIDGSGFSVAVIDSWVDFNHPKLNSNFRAFVNFTNATLPDSHGTHVAGTVGARDENIGVAPDVGLIGLNVFPDGAAARANSRDILDALTWVLNNHEEYNITAVNMSLGGGFFRSEAEVLGDPRIDLISRLESLGITVISAGGNSYKNNEFQNFGAPAIFSTLAVGAVWQDGSENNFRWGSGAIDFTTGADRVTSFSQRLNASNTIFAPGALINSTVPGDYTDNIVDTDLSGGTSMASPIVAGAVALMQEAARQFGGRLLTPDEIVDIIRSTADTIFDGDDEDDNVVNSNTFYPRLNIYNAVSEIRRRFQALAPNGDPNGTIQGAFLGPQLNGALVAPFLGFIGTDGGIVDSTGVLVNATNVGDTDVDIYRFEVLSPGQVTIAIGSNPVIRDDFDTYLRLFDANGREIAANDDIQSGLNQFSRLSTFLNPGVYYAGISGFDNTAYDPTVAASGVSGETGSYSIQFSLNNSDPNGLISGAVPVTLGTISEPSVFDGFIGADYGNPTSTSDVDLFRVVAPDNGQLFIDIDTPFLQGFVDSYLRLFDEEGNELFFPNGLPFANNNGFSFDSFGRFTEFVDPFFPGLVFEDLTDRRFFNGHTTDSFLGVAVERGETYYVGVSDAFNTFYDPQSLVGRVSGGLGGQYNLAINFVNNDLNGSITQAIPNVPLPLLGQFGRIGTDGNPVTGQLQDIGERDVDFFRINSQFAGILEVDIDSYSVQSIADTDKVDAVALIFDRQGNLLALNDDNDGSLDPRLLYQIEANTDYFVAVTGYGNENFDPFQLGSGTPGDTGDYVFNSRLIPLAQSGDFSDDIIGNSAVQDIADGSVIRGSIGEDNGFVRGATDVDIYRLTAAETTTFNIQVQAFEEFSADTFLRFFDKNGLELASNDDADDSTRGSFLQVSVQQGETYYIGINGYSPFADSYDPLTGANAAPGDQGSYTIALSSIMTTSV